MNGPRHFCAEHCLELAALELPQLYPSIAAICADGLWSTHPSICTAGRLRLHPPRGVRGLTVVLTAALTASGSPPKGGSPTTATALSASSARPRARRLFRARPRTAGLVGGRAGGNRECVRALNNGILCERGG